MNYYTAMFFIMSAVYLAPHMEAWAGIAFGGVLVCVGWYSLLTEDKDK